MSESYSNSENVSGSKGKDVMHDGSWEPVSTSEEEDSTVKWPAALLKDVDDASSEVDSIVRSEDDSLSKADSLGRWHRALFKDGVQISGEDDDPVEGVPYSQPSNSRKGSIPAAVTDEISKGKCVEMVENQTNKKASSKFLKKFSFKDEKKILRALHKHGYENGVKEFWIIVANSVKLSIPVTQSQIYEKVRRLKTKYVRKSRATKSNQPMSRKDRKLHKLSEKIWGALVKAKEEEEVDVYGKKPQPVLVDEQEVVGDHSQKFEKSLTKVRKDYVNFPVAEALNSVPASERANLEQKWKDLDASMSQLHMRRIDLILETFRAVAPSSGK